VNAGRTWWRLRADGLPGGCTTVAAVRDLITEPDIVYVACGADGLWSSHDLGASFQKVDGIGDARSVAMTTDDQDLVLVAAGDGIYRSTNRGKSFARVSDAVASAVAFDPRNRRLAYAAADGRLLRSTDAGASWPS
jgi:photosystem II stability/assembly factor-like uncharacterized protein